MPDLSELRIEPAPETLDAVRKWLTPVRAAVHEEFLAAYLTGSVLTQGFDAKKSRINVVVMTRTLMDADLAALAKVLPDPKHEPRIDPLFLTRRQLEKSLDTFPIEYLEMKERHLLLEGEDVLGGIEVPRVHLRLQCEHELRGRQIQLRQFLLCNWAKPAALGDYLAASASGFATLFRTLLRLQGEAPPADPARVVERVADVFGLEAEGLLGAHLAKNAGFQGKDEALAAFRRFTAEIERLIQAIDELPVT